jgi:hypothetical protein
MAGDVAQTAPGLGRQHEAVEALAAIDRLQLLDDLWTGYLESGMSDDERTRERELPALRQLVAEMQAGLHYLPSHVRTVRGLVNELDAEVVETTASALRAATPAGELVPSLDFGDYELRGAMIVACDFVLEQVPDEARHLDEKLERLARGEPSSGDFRVPFKCALFLVAAAACVAGAAAIAIATGNLSALATLVGAGVAALIAWGQQNCPGAMSQVGIG